MIILEKMLFVFNPTSGKEKIRNYLLDILDLFNKRNYQVTVYTTQHQGHAKEIVTEIGKDYDFIVCSGGDGTLNEVVSGYMELKEKPVLGYIPSGTTNDFATSIHIPKDMVSAAKLILKKHLFQCDIGKFNTRYFTYVAAFGAFTAVTYMTPQQAKNVLGHQAYILEGVKQLSSIKPVHLKVEYGDNVIEDDFLYGMVSNSTSIGGFKGLTGKYVELNDGLFEVTLIKAVKNPIGFTNVVTSLLTRNFDSEYFYTFKTNQLRITSEQPVDWVLDGEFGGSQTQVDIVNCKEAICICVEEDI